MARPPITQRETETVLGNFRWKIKNKHEYFYRYELDGEGLLTDLFWADKDSMIDNRMGYGDVVVFDTTPRTGRQGHGGVAFVPFVGLSQHRTPIVLGCGVTTSDPSLDSLVWMLRNFKQSNDRRDGPVSVITDDSDAVVAAVKTVFPNANHRFCSRHVEWGIEEHLGGSPAAQSKFRALMYHDACSPAAFQDRWDRFVAKHRTPANERWLDAMYGKREMWAAAFVHGKFFLGMANDQRTECLAWPLICKGLEGMSLPNLRLHAEACTLAMRWDTGVLDDEQDGMPEPLLTTDHWRRRVEEHAARLFTPANFQLVRKQISRTDTVGVVAKTRQRDAASGAVTCIYTVAKTRKRCWPWGVCFGLKQRRGVAFHVERSGGGDLKCSCRKTERKGLPCRHIFCVMRYASMSEIPACCALRRMKRRCRRDAMMERLEELKKLGGQVFELASGHDKEFHEIKEFLETWLEEKR